MNRFLTDADATAELAQSLLATISSLAGWTILLSGELGAGKSTFARAFIRAAGHAGTIPSPTYTLVEPYDVDLGRIYHVDLYRVASEDELRYLGWNELDDGLRLVEWPERVAGLEDNADLSLQLSYEADGRRARMTALSERGISILETLASAESTD